MGTPFKNSIIRPRADLTLGFSNHLLKRRISASNTYSNPTPANFGFKRTIPLIHDGLVYIVPHKISVMHPQNGGLQHQYGNYLLFGVDPEIGAINAGPGVIPY
jgi:hypothetical protein